MGVVGESGCGKSVTALSIMRMINKTGQDHQGRYQLLQAGQELLKAK
jgi:ABC-type dipeptide/oligopeptide/nickel transport system ATPase component